MYWGMHPCTRPRLHATNIITTIHSCGKKRTGAANFLLLFFSNFGLPRKYTRGGTRAHSRCSYCPWLSVLQLDVSFNYDILALINLRSTASLEFACSCRRRYLVFILVQCLLIWLHLRKLLNTDIYLTALASSRSPIYSYFLLADPLLLSSVTSSHPTFNLFPISPPLWVSVCQVEREGEKGYLLSRGGLRSPSLVLLVCVFSVRAGQICLSADSAGKAEYLVTPVLICGLLCSSNTPDIE